MTFWLANRLLVLGGHKRIDFRRAYLLVDLVALILIATGFMSWGGTFRSAALALLTIDAAVVTFTDFSRHIIPDKLTITTGMIGIVAAIVLPDGSIIHAMLGGTVGFLLFLGISVAGQAVLKKEAMGGGDIKMAAVIGILSGWQGVLSALSGGAILALAFVSASSAVGRGRLSRRVPFGPFLGTAAAVFLAARDCIWEIVVQLQVL